MRLRELEVRYKALSVPIDRPQVTTPEAAAAILRSILELEPAEVFGALLLNTKHRVLCWAEISRGGLNATVVRPPDVFLRAIMANADAMIVAHNHPSGDVSPSPDDAAITERLCAAGTLLGISVLDHVIIGEAGAYFSFKGAGRL